MNSNISRGFSLLEVVIALLIISITFLAYNQLIEQNLKSQELKQIFIQESDKKLNLLTIYVSDPDINQYDVRQILDINEISETKISSFRNFDEIKIDFITDDESVYITIIK
ncbi:MAG: prepilin-type N-terminal cleavage/methylation domain-containing protein [Pseudomonadota bacterium]|nr:prepilin-type N-terminal cleavage/methylation domain-containing protein [Pseudomonadota bacterium]